MSKHGIISIFYISSLLICLLVFKNIFWYLCVFQTLIYVGLTVWGVFYISLSYFGTTTNSFSNSKTVLLTFDDGPDPIHTPIILAILAKYNVKAVFFCIGSRIKKYPKIVQQIVHEGHIVANHTFTHHLSFTFMSVSNCEKELLQTEHCLKELNIKSYQIFRPPYGVTNPSIIKAAKNLGLKVMGWNIRSLDTMYKNPTFVLRRINKAKLGDIVLFHDTMNITSSILEGYLSFLESKKLLITDTDELKSLFL
jgi:peptidoglycan-N-acetylglucosamine deacetylase